MTVPMIFVVKILETIEIALAKSVNNGVTFDLLKIKNALQESVEIARPLISEKDEENEWLLHATSKPFDGIEKGRLFSSLSTIKPDVLRWLLLITRD